MIDRDSDYWQGIYEWKSAEAVELYRRSFILGVMNRPADPGAITYTVISQTRLADYFERWVV